VEAMLEEQAMVVALVEALLEEQVAEMDVSLRERIALLAVSVAVVAALAMGPCHTWGVVRASTCKRPPTSMWGAVATSTLCAQEETSHA